MVSFCSVIVDQICGNERVILPVEKAKINPDDQIEKMFWKTKGVEDVATVAHDERKLFLDELRAFRSGFNIGGKCKEGMK